MLMGRVCLTKPRNSPPDPLTQTLMFTGTLILTYSAQLVKVVQ